jgi:hypothetical protein
LKAKFSWNFSCFKFSRDCITEHGSYLLRVQARSKHNITLDQVGRLGHFLKQLRVTERLRGALAVPEHLVQPLNRPDHDALLDVGHGGDVGEGNAASPLVDDVDEAELELVAVLRRAFLQAAPALDVADEEGQLFDFLDA